MERPDVLIELGAILIGLSLLARIAGLLGIPAIPLYLLAGRIGRRAGLDTRGRTRVGTLLIAPGEFSIVIAVIAAASGLEDVGPLAAAYVLILAVFGPLVVRFADRAAPAAPGTTTHSAS